MTHHPAPGHRAVIEAALMDWWTTTDPMQPFDAPEVADHVELYLLSSGYEIGPNTGSTPVTSLPAIAFNLFLALIGALGTYAFITEGIWIWAVGCLALTTALAHEARRDITERLHARRSRHTRTHR